MKVFSKLSMSAFFSNVANLLKACLGEDMSPCHSTGFFFFLQYQEPGNALLFYRALSVGSHSRNVNLFQATSDINAAKYRRSL